MDEMSDGEIYAKLSRMDALESLNSCGEWKSVEKDGLPEGDTWGRTYLFKENRRFVALQKRFGRWYMDGDDFDISICTHYAEIKEPPNANEG